MAAGQGNFFQAVFYLLGIFNICRGNRRHAYDAVHGRADIMAHIGKKLALRLAGTLRRLPGLVQIVYLPSG